jgi:hypothetical protein
VIGERALFDLEAMLTQQPKESRRMPDRRDGNHGVTGEIAQFASCSATDCEQAPGHEPHADRARPLESGAIDDDRIHARKSRCRLAQRPRRQQPPVADSTRTVDHDDLQRYVQDLGMRLARSSQRPNLPWSFAVLDSPAVNAFARFLRSLRDCRRGDRASGAIL